MKMEWRRNKGRFANGESLYVGAFKHTPIAGYNYDIGAKRENPNKEATWFSLPGIANTHKRVFATHEEARAHCERVVRAWFTKALEEEADDKAT